MPRRLLDTFLLPATVTANEPLGRRWRALTLEGPRLAGLAVVPGQQVRVQVGAANPLVDRLVGTLRTYSVWSYGGGRMALRVLDHGGGPGAAWGRTARPGDRVRLGRPEGRFVTRPSAYHLFAGEETASAAFGPMLAGLGPGVRVDAVVEVDGEDDRLPIPGVRWVHRDGRPAAGSAGLVAAVAALDLPPAPGTAYLAGEVGTVRLVRDHLVRERGWDRRDVLTKPFWAPGRTGLE
ncbi:siderophore-interacting protein [Kitasatospora sp. NPDC057198]|uniref:siderophore-interacting protein n=1 Tax=Kitasatospora sp. NPDC057198 TaxID=3346046 RepID=UPI0036321E9E